MPPKELLKKLKRLFKLLLIAFLIGGIVFWLRSDFWQVKKVNCRLNGSPCPLELWAELMNKTSGKNFLFLSSNKLAWQIKENHPEFFQVKVSKQLLNDLLFEIVARKEVVAIGEEDGDFYLADKDGILLEKTSQPPNLPLVLVSEKINQAIEGKIQDELILKEIQLLHQSQLRLLEPKSAKATSERAIETWFDDNIQVLFSAQKDILEQLDSLQFILERTKIEGEKPKVIDLRFDKPVIVK